MNEFYASKESSKVKSAKYRKKIKDWNLSMFWIFVGFILFGSDIHKHVICIVPFTS